MSDVNIICLNWRKTYDDEKGGVIIAEIAVENMTDDDIIIEPCVLATKPIKLGSITIFSGSVKVVKYCERLKPHDNRIHCYINEDGDDWNDFTPGSIPISMKTQRITDLYRRLEDSWENGDGNWGPPSESDKYEFIKLDSIKVRLHNFIY